MHIYYVYVRNPWNFRQRVQEFIHLWGQDIEIYPETQSMVYLPTLRIMDLKTGGLEIPDPAKNTSKTLDSRVQWFLGYIYLLNYPNVGR